MNQSTIRRGTYLLAGILSLAATIAQAASIVPTDDNFIRNTGTTPTPDYANTVQGWTSETMLLKQDLTLSSSNNRRSYLKFDLSGGGFHNNYDAVFSIVTNTIGATTNVDVYALKPNFVPSGGVLGTNWTESTITWNNAPANNTGGQGFTSAATKIGTFSDPNGLAAGTEYYVTLPRVASYLQNDNTVTLMLVAASADTGTNSFRTSESVTPPRLTQTSVLLNDTFDITPARGRNDSDRDPRDAQWYASTAGGTPLSIVNDSGAGKLNSGNALSINAGDFGRAYAVISQADLNLSAGYKLSFDMRAETTGIPADPDGIRFGIFTDAGTTLSADGGSSADDFGYFIRMGINNGTAGVALIREIAGDTTLGGGIQGPVIGSAPFAGLVEGVPYHFDLFFQLTESGLEFTLDLDGQTILTATDATPLLTSFNLIGFGKGGTNFPLLVDNVELTVVPEPASVILWALVGVCAAPSLRRGWRKKCSGTGK